MTSNIAFRNSAANLHKEGGLEANNVADMRRDEATIAKDCKHEPNESNYI
jgi:hypothetical protein